MDCHREEREAAEKNVGGEKGKGGGGRGGERKKNQFNVARGERVCARPPQVTFRANLAPFAPPPLLRLEDEHHRHRLHVMRRSVAINTTSVASTISVVGTDSSEKGSETPGCGEGVGAGWGAGGGRGGTCLSGCASSTEPIGRQARLDTRCWERRVLHSARTTAPRSVVVGCERKRRGEGMTKRERERDRERRFEGATRTYHDGGHTHELHKAGQVGAHLAEYGRDAPGH